MIFNQALADFLSACEGNPQPLYVTVCNRERWEELIDNHLPSSGSQAKVQQHTNQKYLINDSLGYINFDRYSVHIPEIDFWVDWVYLEIDELTLSDYAPKSW